MTRPGIEPRSPGPLANTKNKEIDKYLDLAKEMKMLWNMKMTEILIDHTKKHLPGRLIITALLMIALIPQNYVLRKCTRGDRFTVTRKLKPPHVRTRNVIQRGPASFWWIIHVPELVIILVLKKMPLHFDSPLYIKGLSLDSSLDAKTLSRSINTIFLIMKLISVLYEQNVFGKTLDCAGAPSSILTILNSVQLIS